MEKEIDWLREKIDQLDAQILELINKRAELALAIGEVKKSKGLPVFSPEREEELLSRVRERNNGPLKDDAVARVYAKIIEETRELELSVG
jgi:chorismate mutase